MLRLAWNGAFPVACGRASSVGMCHLLSGGGMSGKLLSTKKLRYVYLLLAFALAAMCSVFLLGSKAGEMGRQVASARASDPLLLSLFSLMPPWCAALICRARIKPVFHLMFVLFLCSLCSYLLGKRGFFLKMEGGTALLVPLSIMVYYLGGLISLEPGSLNQILSFLWSNIPRSNISQSPAGYCASPFGAASILFLWLFLIINGFFLVFGKR